MNRYKIEGGNKLKGSIDIHGAKNAALPILAACVINNGKSVIHNCPDLTDIQNTIEILNLLGCTVARCGTTLTVDSSKLCHCNIPKDIMIKTRSSTMFAGALAARCKKTFIAGHGGCQIGSRPIDIHLDSFRKLGMEIREDSDGVTCLADNIKPCSINLRFPSVGATENIMLAVSLTPGKTIIINAAKEPEIQNLADFLRSMGVRITGDGTEIISIWGTDSPTNAEVTVIPDRIVASSYLSAALVTKSSITLNNIIPRHLSSFIATVRKMGASLSLGENSVTVYPENRLENIPYVSTAPYPGFPTDSQALLASVMSVSKGLGIIRESIFENRFGHCGELVKMGANIEIEKGFACIKGVKNLKGAELASCDLRCGAALCVAALGAEGTSYVSNVHYIDRGYENLCQSLKKLGAKIERIE